jgi:hypothetical protein
MAGIVRVRLLLILGFLRLTDATYSIAATDSATRQVGGAGASCVENFSIYGALYHGVPDHGVLMTQASPPPEGSPVYEVGRALLLNDTDPAVILTTITDPSLDGGNESVGEFADPDKGNYTLIGFVTFDHNLLRQYGCVDLIGRAAGYEDATLKEYYYAVGYVEGEDFFANYTQEHKTGTIDTFTYSAQGNIITDATVDSIAESFKLDVNESDGGVCALAARLHRAIVAPSLMLRDAMEREDETLLAGDVRCFGSNGAAAAGMFLHVDNPDGSVLVHIDIAGVEDPYPAFQEAYDAWRANSTCSGAATTPTATPASGGTEPPSGAPPSGGAGTAPTGAPSAAGGYRHHLWMPTITSAVWALVVAVALGVL